MYQTDKGKNFLKNRDVKIKDVANRAGVSPATVSNVLNGTKFVSPDLKDRVNKAILDLDYQVDYIASRMKRKSTNTIGVVFTTLNLVFTAQVIKGIESVISNTDYKLIFYTTDNNIVREMYCIRMLVASKVDGIILDTSAHEEKDSDYLKSLANLRTGDKSIPVVSIERNLVNFGIHSVHVNNVAGGELSTRYLIDCGCRRIGLITGPTFSDLVRDRIIGYKNMLAKNGIPFDAELIIRGDFTPLSGYRAVNYLVKEGIVFDGIFCCNDEMAIGAIRGLAEREIAVPDDVKVMGFDNTFISSLVTPQISTVNVPKFRIGSSAARVLVELMQNDDVQGVDLSCEMSISIVIRASTDKGKVSGWDLDGW